MLLTAFSKCCTTALAATLEDDNDDVPVEKRWQVMQVLLDSLITIWYNGNRKVEGSCGLNRPRAECDDCRPGPNGTGINMISEIFPME